MAKFIRLPAVCGEDYIVNTSFIVEVTHLNEQNKQRLVDSKGDEQFRAINCQVLLEAPHGVHKLLTTKTITEIEHDLNRETRPASVH